jgi:hypothetical protein
MRMDDITSA